MHMLQYDAAHTWVRASSTIPWCSSYPAPFLPLQDLSEDGDEADSSDKPPAAAAAAAVRPSASYVACVVPAAGMNLPRLHSLFLAGVQLVDSIASCGSKQHAPLLEQICNSMSSSVDCCPVVQRGIDGCHGYWLWLEFHHRQQAALTKSSGLPCVPGQLAIKQHEGWGTSPSRGLEGLVSPPAPSVQGFCHKVSVTVHSEPQNWMDTALISNV